MRRYLLSLFLLANITVFVMPAFAQFPLWSPFPNNGVFRTLAYDDTTTGGESSTDASSTTEDDVEC
jgi:hypothetical protein